jgi:hypothetical protein
VNLERILQHKGVIVWALRIGAKKVESVKKGEQDAELPTAASDHRLAVIEELLGELDMQGGPALEGTPMGDAVAAQVYRAEDGTPLDVDSLDEMLRRVGVDAPLGKVGEWSLDQRRAVYAWVKGEQERILNLGPEEEAEKLPDVIDPMWCRGNDEILEHPLDPDEVDAAIAKGPWFVAAGDPQNPASDEWAIRKDDPADSTGATYVEHPQQYGQLDRARLIAANLNLIELGRSSRVHPDEQGGGVPAEMVEGEQYTSAEYDAEVRRLAAEASADPSVIRSEEETFAQ